MNEEAIVDELRNSKDPMAGDFTRRFDRNLERMRPKVAPPGAIKAIPPLLESKRLEHCIPDGCFSAQPVYDYCYIYQVAGHVTSAGTYGAEGKIYVPENIQGADRQSTPTGVLVAAGLTALDQLWSHGIAIGHTVFFCQQAPHHLPVEIRDGKEEYVILVRAGLIRGSVEQRAQIESGELQIGAVACKAEDGQTYYRHCFKDAQGQMRMPTEVQLWEDW